MEQIAAVVLAAGQGSRMKSSCPKQYLEIHGKPMIYYSLKAFEESPVNEVVLVVGFGQEQQCQKEIVERFGFQKVKKVVTGGTERYFSVCYGLRALEQMDYVLIHDGARPMLTNHLICKTIDSVRKYKACAAAVLSKDTVKLIREDKTVEQQLERSKVRLMQTPQAFVYSEIREAYEKLMRQTAVTVTDDAQVYEWMLGKPVTLFEGSYQNIKVTTPEDLEIAKLFLFEEF